MTDLPRENVQSYPRPPSLEPVPQRIMIQLGGVVVAETNRALRVLETHHAPSYYLPADDIRATLRPVQGSSLCEWKGVARYFDVVAGGKPPLAPPGPMTAPPPALRRWRVVWPSMPG